MSGITGYRELTVDEVAWINTVEQHGNDLERLIDNLAKAPGVDQRWLSIARTDLQKGIMSLVRSVAKPTSF